MKLPGRRPRFLKIAQNLVTDPLPRQACLALTDIKVDRHAVHVVYDVGGRSYSHGLRFTQWSAQKPLTAVVDAQLGTALGLVLAPHLFILTDFATVDVRTGTLTAAQREFWSWYLKGGLGEYRYRAGLDPTRPVEVQAHDRPGIETRHAAPSSDVRRAIILNGGGKDTAVAAELAARSGIEADWLTVTPTTARRALVAASGRPSAFEAVLDIDEAMVRDARYRRGHVPYFSLFLMAGVIAALAGGYEAVIAGNERSADEGNLMFRGMEVNHQFSKSSAFERAFQQHVLDASALPLRAFSLLRPFSDLRLAQLFVRLPQYFPVCVSCNRRAKASTWCLDCPKCAFVGLAFGAFVDDDVLRRIFGALPQERAELRRQWLALVRGKIKPWECVGTQEECRLALRLFLDRRPDWRPGGRPGREALARAVVTLDLGESSTRVLEGQTGSGVMPPDIEARVLDAAAGLARLE